MPVIVIIDQPHHTAIIVQLHSMDWKKEQEVGRDRDRKACNTLSHPIMKTDRSD